MTSTPLQLTATDGYQLAAGLFRAQASARSVVVIASATGVPQGYYAKFAAFAAERGGMDVVTFDYRGIGGSLHGKLTDNTAKMSDWGTLDLQAALAWCFSRYERVCLVGHSVAGQIFPLAELSQKVSAAWLVGSQCAASHLWDGRYRLAVKIFWHLANPLSTAVLGYMPGFVVGGGPGLPKAVALEWRRWGLHRNGVWQDDEEVIKKFKSLQLPVQFVSITDDHMLAPPRAVKYLQTQYAGARSSFLSLHPADFGLRRLGHFGFFRSRAGEILWELPITYLQENGNI